MSKDVITLYYIFILYYVHHLNFKRIKLRQRLRLAQPRTYVFCPYLPISLMKTAKFIFSND